MLHTVDLLTQRQGLPAVDWIRHWQEVHMRNSRAPHHGGNMFTMPLEFRTLFCVPESQWNKRVVEWQPKGRTRPPKNMVGWCTHKFLPFEGPTFMGSCCCKCKQSKQVSGYEDRCSLFVVVDRQHHMLLFLLVMS